MIGLDCGDVDGLVGNVWNVWNEAVKLQVVCGQRYISDES